MHAHDIAIGKSVLSTKIMLPIKGAVLGMMLAVGSAGPADIEDHYINITRLIVIVIAVGTGTWKVSRMFASIHEHQVLMKRELSDIKKTLSTLPCHPVKPQNECEEPEGQNEP